MTTVRFPTGDPLWDDIQAQAVTADYQFLIALDTWTPDPVTEVMVDDISANEPVDGSYSRVNFSFAVATVGVSLDLATGIWTFTADDPDFGALAGAEDLGWVIAAADTGNDATSKLMRAYQIPGGHTTDGSPFIPRVNSAGLCRRKNP